MRLLIQKSTITPENPEITSGWKKFDGCPSYGDVIISKSNGAPKLKSKERIFNEERKTTNKWKNKTLVKDPEIIKLIETQIQNRFVKQYKNIRGSRYYEMMINFM